MTRKNCDCCGITQSLARLTDGRKLASRDNSTALDRESGCVCCRASACRALPTRTIENIGAPLRAPFYRRLDRINSCAPIIPWYRNYPPPCTCDFGFTPATRLIFDVRSEKTIRRSDHIGSGCRTLRSLDSSACSPMTTLSRAALSSEMVHQRRSFDASVPGIFFGCGSRRVLDGAAVCRSRSLQKRHFGTGDGHYAA